MATNRSFGDATNAKYFDYAVTIVETVTWLAGRANYLDDVREAIRDLDLFRCSKAIRAAKLFDWLAAAMSYQGISDEVSRSYNLGSTTTPKIDTYRRG